MIILGALTGFFLLSGGSMALTTPAVAPSLHQVQIHSVEGTAGANSVGRDTTRPMPSTLPSYGVTLTAYNAVPAQTDSDPFVTASGAYSNPEVVAARSVNLADELPFGTIIEIDGSNISSGGTCGYGTVVGRIGYRVIADAMNARYTNRVDVLFDTKANYMTADGTLRNAAGILGVCKGTTVRVVGYIDIRQIPRTQAELASIVSGSGRDIALR
jgi:3D (Asp-Asp-Asp) domain-containing protein